LFVVNNVKSKTYLYLERSNEAIKFCKSSIIIAKRSRNLAHIRYGLKRLSHLKYKQKEFHSALEHEKELISYYDSNLLNKSEIQDKYICDLYIRFYKLITSGTISQTVLTKETEYFSSIGKNLNRYCRNPNYFPRLIAINHILYEISIFSNKKLVIDTIDPQKCLAILCLVYELLYKKTLDFSYKKNLIKYETILNALQ